MKKFILNADNFGMSKAHNRAVLDGYHNGFLTSASLCPNGKAFNAAVNEIVPECPNLGIGVQLNLSEGRSLTKAPLLTNKKGKFNNNFIKLMIKSNNNKFLEQIEFELRTQIETVMNYAKIDHISSNNHVHSIPNIFGIVVKLAKEYNIPFIRTHYEELYFVPNFKKHLNLKYPKNILNLLLLNMLTTNNKKILSSEGLYTNNFIIGIGYSNLMDEKTVELGLAEIDENSLTEVVIRPCNYAISSSRRNYKEFLITQNKALKDKILRMGFEITNYKKEKAIV